MTTNKHFGFPPKDACRFAEKFTSPYDLQSIEIAFNKLQGQMRAPVKSWSARSLAIAIILSDFPDEDERKLLDKWEKIVFRIFGLCQEDARKEQKVFCQLISRMLKDDLNCQDISQGIREIGANYTFDIDKEELYDVDRYTGWQGELRYLLCRYEEYLAERHNKPLSDESRNRIRKFSIEHILPQTANSQLSHALGNFILLPRELNSKLGNKNPQQKADAYRQTGLFSVIEVADWINEYSGTEPGFEDWHDPCILTRTNTLVDWIYAEFCDV